VVNWADPAQEKRNRCGERTTAAPRNAGSSSKTRNAPLITGGAYTLTSDERGEGKEAEDRDGNSRAFCGVSRAAEEKISLRRFFLSMQTSITRASWFLCRSIRRRSTARKGLEDGRVLHAIGKHLMLGAVGESSYLRKRPVRNYSGLRLIVAACVLSRALDTTTTVSILSITRGFASGFSSIHSFGRGMAWPCCWGGFLKLDFSSSLSRLCRWCDE